MPIPRKKLVKFAGFQCIDPGKNIGVPVDWIDTVPLGGSDEREVYGNGFRTVVGACKKAVLSHKNPGFNSALCLIVVCALTRCTGPVGTKSHPATLAPAGSTRGGSGGDKWSEALWEKPLK